MDVSNVMNTYDMTSLWNSINPSGTSSYSSVPLVDNLNSAIQGSYEQAGYFGESANSELQDLYNQIEPSYNIPLTYDSSGNLSIPTSTDLPSNGLSVEDSNILSLIQGSESNSELANTSILNEYNDIEDGTYQTNISSILSSNPYNMYNYVDSLQNNENQITGNYLDFSA